MNTLPPQVAARSVLAALISVAAAGVRVPAAAPPPVQSDVRIQSLIDGLLRSPARDLNYYQKVIALREIARGRHAPPGGEREVILQAALYSAHGERPPKAKPGEVEDDGGAFDATYALQRVTQEVDIRTRTVVHTLLPYYLHGDDERLRGFIREHVLYGESLTDELPQNDELVDALTMYVGERKKNPPWGVVQLLYWKAPSAALLGLHAFYNKGDARKHDSLVWTEHLVKDVAWKKATGFIRPGELEEAVAQLDKLSRYEEWWVKLYVAEMLRRHPYFRDKQVLARLRADDNALVAKAADVPFHFGKTEDERRLWWLP